jgi:predicted ATPase/class 3 adenylate cyclase/DNA-binding CsgD family transcriptional regulator
MFPSERWLRLVAWGETALRTEMSPVMGGDAGVSEALPIGTITLLLADVEGSTRLWESEPDAMTTAIARLDRIVDETVAGHGGVRPVEQGEGDSFVIAFSRASGAVACALDLQRAPLAPLRLRIGLHTGEAQLRDEHNYMGPAVNRAARIRNLAHGGQTVLSGATHDLVVDHLPDGAWLADLGSHRLRDLARPERVVQLCHPDVPVEFPALRSLDAFAHNLPVQLTSFIGREAEMAELHRLLSDNRLVTLTGAGGAGKTRLALQVAAEMLTEFPAGVWQVDLAPLTDPTVVTIAVARALGLPDEPGRSTVETLIGFVEDRQALVLLDNCEHLLDACAALIEELLRACPALTILTTSREPIGVAGEMMWRVPSLSLAGEAIELFADRAQRAHPGFVVTADHADAVAEICHRLDGIPLAIELAAARVRVFSPAEIVAGLHDRFRLLTGGARTAVRRQQTLRASVDWSHALLTEPERILFRRLAAFAGGFDLDAARAVGGGEGLEQHQVLDQLALLVDKSLVAVEESQLSTRYRLLETVRQYALEKLGESGEADAVRTRHRDHYALIAGRLDAPVRGEHRGHLDRVEVDIDNLRAAFQWSREMSDVDVATRLASSLQPLWLARGRILEGLAWLDAALADQAGNPGTVTLSVRAQSLADAATLNAWTSPTPCGMEQAEEAVALARQLDNPALLARALTAAGCAAGWLADSGRPYFAEAGSLARHADDAWTLAQILGFQTFAAVVSGDPAAARTIGEEGLALADQTGNEFISRQCRTFLGNALQMQGDLSAAKALLSDVVAEAEIARDPFFKMLGLAGLCNTLALLRQTDDARAAGNTSLAIGEDVGVALYEGSGYQCLALLAKASGDAVALRTASEAARQRYAGRPESLAMCLDGIAEADLAVGDLTAARRRADEAVASTTGLNMKYYAMNALFTSARVAVALGDVGRAYDDAYQALAVGHSIDARTGIADILECLAGLGVDADEHPHAARLFGAADAIRRRTGAVRFALYQAGYDATITALHASMGDPAFELAWAEGAALSSHEAVAYALRGRGERKRPTSGWASLTPAERDVVRLLGEGLANKDIATRLFVSPRTVQSHLTHIYTKLDLTSRVQLAQEAARHT